MIPKQIKAVKLPDLFTLAGLISALAAIYLAMQGSFLAAYLLIVFQFVFDALDGRIARKYGGGDLGMYMDSFSDYTVIIATVFFGYYIGINNYWMLAGGVLFIVAAAVRLSFFMDGKLKNKKDFTGIPTVLATILIATLLIANYYSELVSMHYLAALYYIFAYGMISNLKIKKI